ncbi:MAG: DNA/RNA non-specific endonuclease [Kiritimatiellae bacterium]|nr:DNA/RNA non-specific endonuclease [Kiritimatiellia bacterium]
MSAARRRRKKKGVSRARRLALFGCLALLAVYLVFAAVAVWFVHKPAAWRAACGESLPGFLVSSLYWAGNGPADVLDGLGLTGHDVVYEYDEEAPHGKVLFAGAPRRVGDVQPDDITVLDRGEFVVGWSPSLRRPVWCAYHVVPKPVNDVGERPAFQRDKTAANAPSPSAYDRSGYDRGHMVPNFAIVTRYGAAAQKKTFLTSNISPQSPALNRGVWRDFEHRIASLWTARYGEMWVVVGSVPSKSREKIGDAGIDVPDQYFQLVVAQEGLDVRALAVLLDQSADRREWAARHIVTIDELEERTGLDFLPDLPAFIQDPLEAELPTRLWPVRLADIFNLLALYFR